MSESSVVQKPLTDRVLWNGQGHHVFPQADASVQPSFRFVSEEIPSDHDDESLRV